MRTSLGLNYCSFWSTSPILLFSKKKYTFLLGGLCHFFSLYNEDIPISLYLSHNGWLHAKPLLDGILTRQCL